MVGKTKKFDKYLLTGGTIYNPIDKSSKKNDILIDNGVIVDVGKDIALEGYNAIDCSGKIICPGFLDLRSHFGEPGYEDIESLETGSKAALKGGYTKVCMLPNTNPVIDNAESVESLIEKSRLIDINIFPIGSITKNLDGKELSEIGLMVKGGVVAISDAHRNVKNAQVLKNALEYCKMFEIPVINHAENIDLVNDGMSNESFFSSKKGLPANPFISETVGILRDLEIANYIGARIHIPRISSSRSVSIIKRYKDLGLLLTAEVTPHHLGLSEIELKDYNAFYKVSPPLRSSEDSDALIEGLRSGVIDCIVSDHHPSKIEDKESDLLNSNFGTIGLESAFPYSNRILSQKGFSIEQVIDLFTINPSRVMNIDLGKISKNEVADFTVINPNSDWVFEQSHIYSLSKNSCLIGKSMKGKIDFVACKNKFHII